jgi:hypothetical protein
MRTITKTLFACSALASLSFTTAQAATVFNGGTGGDFDTDWDNGVVSSSNPGTVNTSASGLVRATANFGGGWTIDHTAGDLDFSAGGWNVNGNGVGGTYNLSAGSISVIGTGAQDKGNFLVNGIDFNLSGGAVSSELTFRITNGGAMNFLAGAGTLTSAAWKDTQDGTMNFVSGWTGFVNIASETAASWKTMLATTLAGSTFDGVVITTANFDDNFIVTGSVLTVVPEPGTYALIGGLLALGYVMVRRRA